MAELLIRDTHLIDVVRLAYTLRASDLAEVHAYGHTDPLKQVSRSVAQSMLCWTALIDGEVAAILGAAPISVVGGIGSPWMLGTPVLDAHSRILVRQTPRYIARMLQAFPYLVNYVHAKNTTSVRWLGRLGFTLHPAQPFGALGEPFHKFEMKA